MLSTVFGVHEDSAGLDAENADDIELDDYEAELDDEEAKAR